jgi:hypothetical protein
LSKYRTVELCAELFPSIPWPNAYICQNFQQFGEWFRSCPDAVSQQVGTIECFPKMWRLPGTAAIGGWVLSAVMLGAIGTQLLIIGGSVPAGVLLVLAITVAWNRSRR